MRPCKPAANIWRICGQASGTLRHPARLGPARRKLLYLEDAVDLRDLRSPPGNRLELLHGDRAGQYSIRINEQWRICFYWQDGRAHQVKIEDYHG